MSTVSATQVPGLVTDAGYPVSIRAYDSVPTVRDQVMEIMVIDGSEFGFTDKALGGDFKLKETGYGEESRSTTINEGYQVYGRIRKFTRDVELPEELMRNANANAMIMGMIATAAGEFGRGANETKEEIAAAFFNKGAFTAGDLTTFDGSYPGHSDPYPKFIYDGKPWFAASGNGHPLYFQPSVTPYNATTNALSSTNLETVRQLMMDTNAVDENNQKISIRPDTLLVPVALEQTARVIINSELLPGTAQNDVNTLRGSFNVVPWRYLTDTDGWFLGAARRGVKFFDSGTPMIHTSAPHPKTGSVTVRFSTYAGGMVTDWRQWSAHRTATS